MPPRRTTRVQMVQAHYWEGTTYRHRCRLRRTSSQVLITCNPPTTSSPDKISITLSATWSSPGTFQWSPPKTSSIGTVIHTTGLLITNQIQFSSIPPWPACPRRSSCPSVAGAERGLLFCCRIHSCRFAIFFFPFNSSSHLLSMDLRNQRLLIRLLGIFFFLTANTLFY